MQTASQPLPHLAYSQTAKRRMSGCFRKQRRGKHHAHDPLIGRFMSADPFIQAPFDLQSHNRYAYVMNNPLGYTDPSGYFWGWVVAAVAEVAKQTGIISHQQARTIQAIAIGFEMGLVGRGMTGSAITGGAIGGASAGFVGSNGNLQAAARGGLTGAAFGYVGSTYAAGTVGSYAGHGVVGCVSSVSSGGKCGSGAAAAVLGKWVTNETRGWGAGIAQGTAAAVAGGVGSVIAGGKFENGAKTAAFGYLFNPNFPLETSRRLIGRKNCRQIKRGSLVPQALHPSSFLHCKR